MLGSEEDAEYFRGKLSVHPDMNKSAAYLLDPLDKLFLLSG
jgi:hypothetical protein